MELMKVLELLNQRLHGGPRPRDWESPICVLLQKCKNASLLKEFRPITVSSAISRLYDRLVLQLLLPFCTLGTKKGINVQKLSTPFDECMKSASC